MTEKLQLLVRAEPGTSMAAFDATVRERIVPRLLAGGPRGLKVTWTDRDPPWGVIPFRRQPVALFTVWPETPSDDGEWAARVGAEHTVWSYRVEESIPLRYDRDWPDGQDTPGVGLLTVFSRRDGLDDDTFITRWHGGHSALSLQLHPLWCYVRNVVREALDPETPWRDAIVEEHFRTRDDLLRPSVFFGGPLAMWPNMVRVALDIRRFIDLGSMETWLVRERYLRTPSQGTT